MPKAESKVKWTSREAPKKRWGGVFEGKKGSSYSRDMDPSLKVTKTTVGKEIKPQSLFFSVALVHMEQ